MNDKKMKLIKLKESLDVTPVGDDDEVPAAHKPKQKRKWMKKSKYQRLQKRKKKEKITPAMEKVLNRGLNFSIMPLKLNLTQVLSCFGQNFGQINPNRI